MAALPDTTQPDGLIVQLPATPGQDWRWWRVSGGALGREHGFDPADEAPWGGLDEGAVVTVLVPAALAPVQDKPLPDMPVPQALAATRLSLHEAAIGGGERHAAVAAADGRLLSASLAAADMDGWLASLEAVGLQPQTLVPAALVLPRHDTALVLGDLGGQRLARTPSAAFTAEPALIGALASAPGSFDLDEAAMNEALLAAHAAPPLNLRQGIYAPRRVSFFRVPAWGQLARMTATAALLALALMLVWIVKWNLDSAAHEAETLALVQTKFPAASDLDSAERIVAAELAKRGQGGASFSAPAAALLAAMRPVPALRLRDLGYSADGTLRFTAAAPRADDVNAVLLALQRDGWKVTVPPSLAPDPTGATVAAITLRAP